jgi:hypothetical protein
MRSSVDAFRFFSAAHVVANLAHLSVERALGAAHVVTHHFAVVANLLPHFLSRIVAHDRTAMRVGGSSGGNEESGDGENDG